MLCGEQIMEDLLSRFQRTRVSYELKPEEAEVIRAKFNAASSSACNPARSLPGPLHPNITAQGAKEFRLWKDQHPSILEQFEEFAKLVRGKRLAVFLDYDGTLTPIVTNPDRAFMSEQMRSAVQTVAGLFPTSIISGRGREKVEAFVQLKELFYAGSHGMDIVGPQASSKHGDEHRLAFQPAAKYAPIMDAVYRALVDRVEKIPGAAVEHNKFCVSVHFRNCSPEAYEHVVTAVKDTLNDHPNLKASRGRKVLEIQPQVDWGKGRALAHMLNALGLDNCDDVIPIYLGDDRTDEDAFKVLNERATGFGILISNKMKETDAKYTLADPAEVMAFLTRLLEWGATPNNAWHSHQSCTGWTLKQQAPLPPTQPQGVLAQTFMDPQPASTSEQQQHSAMPSGTSDHAHHQQDSQDHLSDDQHTRPQHQHAKGTTAQPHWAVEAGQEQAATSNSSSPGHTSSSGSAFATVRQFHGLPASTHRAMPAAQWLTKTDSLSQPKPESASVTQEPAGQLKPETFESRHQSSASEQAADDEAADEYGQMAGSDSSARRQMQTAGREEDVKQIEAEGRPPTGKPGAAAEQASSSPSRTSLDHYLHQPYKAAAHESGEAGHMGRWDAGEGVMPETEVAQHSKLLDALQEARRSGDQPMLSMPPVDHVTSGRAMPEGKRLTALLLDKLQGHDTQRTSGDEVMSPPGHSSNSNSSLAGYQSPFESLAHEAMSVSEDTDSIKAEVGSVGSFNLGPSK